MIDSFNHMGLMILRLQVLQRGPAW